MDDENSDDDYINNDYGSRKLISYNDLFLNNPVSTMEGKIKRKLPQELNENIRKKKLQDDENQEIKITRDTSVVTNVHIDLDKSMETENNITASQGQKQATSTETETVSKNTQRIILNKYQETVYKFNESNKGPYSVWIKEIVPGKNRLEAYIVASILFKKKYTQISNIITKNGKNVEIFFKTFDEANRLISDKTLLQHNLQVFVPTYRKIRKGIIRNIPENLDINELAQGIETEVEVESIMRLMRKNRDGNSEEKWIPSRSLIVSFIGQIIPTHISIFKVRTLVDPFVSSPLQCYRCFKFGHSAKVCKSQEVCIQCAEDKHEGTRCELELKCRNCSKDHRSTSHDCEVYQDFYKINVIMAYDNLPFSDAYKQICGDKYKKVPLRTKENFPQLREKKKNMMLNKFNDNRDTRSYSQTLQEESNSNKQVNHGSPNSTQTGSQKSQRQQHQKQEDIRPSKSSDTNGNKIQFKIKSSVNANLNAIKDKNLKVGNIVDRVASKLTANNGNKFVETKAKIKR